MLSVLYVAKIPDLLVTPLLLISPGNKGRLNVGGGLNDTKIFLDIYSPFVYSQTEIGLSKKASRISVVILSITSHQMQA